MISQQQSPPPLLPKNPFPPPQQDRRARMVMRQPQLPLPKPNLAFPLSQPQPQPLLSSPQPQFVAAKSLILKILQIFFTLHHMQAALQCDSAQKACKSKKFC